MKPAERVREKYPRAYANIYEMQGGTKRCDIENPIVTNLPNLAGLHILLGTGANEPAAWIDAAAKLDPPHDPS